MSSNRRLDMMALKLSLANSCSSSTYPKIEHQSTVAMDRNARYNVNDFIRNVHYDGTMV